MMKIFHVLFFLFVDVTIMPTTDWYRVAALVSALTLMTHRSRLAPRALVLIQTYLVVIQARVCGTRYGNQQSVFFFCSSAARLSVGIHISCKSFSEAVLACDLGRGDYSGVISTGMLGVT